MDNCAVIGPSMNVSGGRFVARSVATYRSQSVRCPTVGNPAQQPPARWAVCDQRCPPRALPGGAGAHATPFRDANRAPTYAAIRADRTIKAPDAIQLSCAAAAGVDLFITIVSDGAVAARWTVRGTHRSEFQGIPASGKSIDVSGITIHHIRDERISETWLAFDTMTLARQIS